MGVREQVASGIALPLFERLENQALFLCAHALDGSHPAASRGLLEIVERPDVQLTIEHGDRLGPDALQVQEVQDARRKFRDELRCDTRTSRFGNLADSRGEVLSDARDFAKPGDVERLAAVRMVRHDIGAVPVRANLEGVLGLDLQQIGDFTEHARDRRGYPSGGLRLSMW